jgi:hypothetical protein
MQDMQGNSNLSRIKEEEGSDNQRIEKENPSNPAYPAYAEKTRDELIEIQKEYGSDLPPDWQEFLAAWDATRWSQLS